MNRTVVIAVLACASQAQGASWRHLLRFSQAALVAGTAADVASSFGKRELDPVLGRGQYGMRQASIEIAITGAMLTVQEIVLHRKPFLTKRLAIVNLVRTGAFAGLAVYNQRLPSK